MASIRYTLPIHYLHSQSPQRMGRIHTHRCMLRKQRQNVSFPPRTPHTPYMTHQLSNGQHYCTPHPILPPYTSQLLPRPVDWPSLLQTQPLWVQDLLQHLEFSYISTVVDHLLQEPFLIIVMNENSSQRLRAKGIGIRLPNLAAGP